MSKKCYAVSCYTCNHNGQETCKGCNTLLVGDDEPYENWELREDLQRKDDQLAEKDQRIASLEEINKSSNQQIERLKHKLELIISDNQDLNKKVKELEEDLLIERNQVDFQKHKVMTLEKEQTAEYKAYGTAMSIADAKIKELEKENKQMHTILNQATVNQIAMKDYIKKLTTVKDENVTKLQTQLHEQPKKICEEIRKVVMGKSPQTKIINNITYCIDVEIVTDLLNLLEYIEKKV